MILNLLSELPEEGGAEEGGAIYLQEYKRKSPFTTGCHDEE